MGILTPWALRLGALPWMPRFLPWITRCDRTLRALTRGRLGLLDLAGLPNAVLTVRGRVSGRPRTTPLLCVRERSHWFIAGSCFGAASDPAWVHNLRAARTAVLGEGSRSVEVVADELASGERDRAWEILCRAWPNFDVYQRRTDRLIPVFRLDRA